MESMLRPKFNYINEGNWEGLHILANHWKSDLDFHLGEIRFLKKLIDKYFVWLVNDESIASAEKLLSQLEELRIQGESTMHLINKHLHQIVEEIRMQRIENDKAFKDEHTTLEEQIAKFTMKLRPLKKVIFDLVEDVLEEEKIKHLMSK